MIDHANNFHTSYYHLVNERVTNGQQVNTGDWLGDIGVETPCGGYADGEHVHFSVWNYSGTFSFAAISAQSYSLDGVDIGGYTLANGSAEYLGSWTRLSDGFVHRLTVWGMRCCVRNDGLVGSGGGPTPPTTPPPTSPTTPPPSPGNTPPALLSPLVPTRVFDTRPADPQGAVSVVKRRYGGGNVLRVKLAGVAGIPLSGVGAVSLNVTVADPVGSGFVTVFPCGTRPLAANLNYERGQVVPNAVIAPVSDQGEVCFYSLVDTHLIADVNGWFASGAGFVGVAPARLVDTRPTDPQGAIAVDKQRFGGGNVLRVRVVGAAGLPASGIAAVSLNVTVVDPDGPGFVTVFPCGDRPLAANLNYVQGQVVPNAVIAPVSAAGEVCFYSLAETDLVADVNGWFASGAGFAGLVPARLFDTRASAPQGAVPITKQMYGGGTVLRVKVTGAGGVPGSGVGAVSLNVTAVEPVGAGFVTVFPCGDRPLAANLNYVAGQVVPNAVLAPVSASGEVCFFSLVATDLVADVNGWFAA